MVNAFLPQGLKDVKALVADPKPTAPATAKPPEKTDGNTRYKAMMRVKLGTSEFNSLNGDILHGSYIWLSTRRFSEAKVFLNDPDGNIRDAIADQQDIEIEIGFADGERRNKFVGKIQKIGRRPPDATVVVAADPSSQMAQQAGPSIQTNASQPTSTDAQARKVGDEKPTIDKIKAILQTAGTQPTAATLQSIQALITQAKTAQTTATQTQLAQTSDDRLQQITVIITEGAKQPPAATAQKIQTLLTKPAPVATTGTGAVAATPTSQETMLSLLDNVSKAAAQGKPTTSAAEQFSLNNHANLKFAKETTFASSEQGVVRLQQSQMQLATQQATLQGDAIVARGNTVRQVQPGRGDPSGLVLDYAGRREVFVGKPEVLKRTGLQLASVSVTGWDVSGKQSVGATVVVPTEAPTHPTGVIQVRDWGQIKLNEPLFPGSVFTWADATKNGTRVPSKQVMERIVVIAQAIQPLVDKTVGKGKKWNITSWYRDPAANNAAGGASGSRHLIGDAIDFYFDTNGGEASLHRSLESSWDGGLAIKPGSFVHLDKGSRRRWTY